MIWQIGDKVCVGTNALVWEIIGLEHGIGNGPQGAHLLRVDQQDVHTVISVSRLVTAGGSA